MKENPVVPRSEQETVIQISRDIDMARIYTSDSRYINKLDKKYPRLMVHKSGRKIVAVEYEVPSRFISFRSLKERTCSEEQKKKLSDLMKKRREGKA